MLWLHIVGIYGTESTHGLLHYTQIWVIEIDIKMGYRVSSPRSAVFTTADDDYHHHYNNKQHSTHIHS